tara:strand:- start:2514 stop:3512 length:999 start_codon:yes stop_codon:yes gene_type:complete
MSILHFNFYLVLIFSNLFFLYLIKKISYQYSLYDFPNDRKLHQKPTCYLGGALFFFSNFFYLVFFRTFLFESHFLIYNLSHIFSLIFVASLIFFAGLLDDKVDLDPLKKTIILLTLISSAVLIDDKLLITKLNFELIENNFNLKNFSIFFTILCIYIFINACNMYDGADLQLGIYFLIIIIYLAIKSNYFHIFTPLLIPLLIFLYANFKKIFFFGNNGSHFLSYVLAIFIIKFYNDEILISVEEVIIIMLIPVLDLIRLFFMRVLNNKNFFEPDLNHIHHILIKKHSKYKVQLIVFISSVGPILVAEIINSYLLGILFGIFFYFILIFKNKV